MLFNTLLYAVFHNKSHLVRKQRFVIRQNIVGFFIYCGLSYLKAPIGTKCHTLARVLCCLHLDNPVKIPFYVSVLFPCPSLFSSQSVTVMLLDTVLTTYVSSSWKTGASLSFNLFLSPLALINAQPSANDWEHTQAFTQELKQIEKHHTDLI